MNDFPKDTFFEPERIVDDDVSGLSPRAKKLYGEWILDLKKGKTFFGLNWNWPKCFDSWPSGFYDRYVFSWHVEDWDHEWLINFCQAHPDSEIIVISEFPITARNYQLKNLKVIVYHCWGMLIGEALTYSQPRYVRQTQKKHRLSSLVNKPSYFKALTTAYIMQKQFPSLIMSWNINLREDFCNSLNVCREDLAPSEQLKPLIRYYHDHLKDLSIKLDEFNDTRFSNYFCDITAYTDCLVNITNETFSQTSVNGIILPGPFITEKNWKPLLAGCALLSQGPARIYPYLKQFGFVFDYPWSMSYDDLEGDIDRFLGCLQTIDQVCSYDQFELAEVLEPSAEHNYHHIRSPGFQQTIKDINQHSIDAFLSQDR